jgi:hypothetical protein
MLVQNSYYFLVQQRSGAVSSFPEERKGCQLWNRPLKKQLLFVQTTAIFFIHFIYKLNVINLKVKVSDNKRNKNNMVQRE